MNGSLGISRPSSEQVRDLHVYVIPPELWRQHLRSAANEVIADSISLGFLRIPPHIHLQELRQEIVAQLGDECLPKDYAFLKSVGRCLTQVKSRQERELKVKHFLPPYAYAPELYLLDSHAESMRDSPSTIFQHSLSGTSLPKTGSKADSTGYQSGNPTASKYPSSHPEHSTSYRAPGKPAADDGPYSSQAFDQLPTNSSYPAYSNPYSHDISALTNAHRNQVDTSRSYDSYNNKGGDTYNHRGGETYRKHNDDSSGYQSIPSPKKVSESPSRLHHGDHSMERRLHKGSSDLHNSYQGNYRSPNGRELESPHRTHRGDVGPSSRLQNRNGTLSPERRDQRGPSNHSSPERSKILSDDASKVNSSGRDWENGPDTSDSNYERQEGAREMMSATPNSSPAKIHAADGNHGTVDHSGRESHQSEVLESDDPDQPGKSENTRKASGKKTLSDETQELMRLLRNARDERLASEKKREELVKKARAMQAKTNNRRNQAREIWKKKYYEAKKQTPALEADCQRLRSTLDSLHKKHLTALENVPVEGKQKENYPLEAAKLEYEVDELQRKADASKMKLTAEMKLRNQAETELRALRAELTQKKMNMNLSRAQKINSIGNSVLSISSQP